MTRDRIVVLRALGLGDLLASVPALYALRDAYPDHDITLATPRRFDGLLGRDDLVDRVVDTGGLDRPIRVPAGPMLGVNLHGSGPQSHALINRLRPRRTIAYACAEANMAGPHWRSDEHERRRWSRLIATCCDAAYAPDRVALTPPEPIEGIHGAVVVHPGASAPSRRWPVDRWAEVAREVARQRAVLITGDASEVRLAEQVSRGAELDDTCVVAGQTDVDDLARVVASAALVISGDTGIAHLAAAYGTPSVTLFGPTPPSQWGPPAAGPHSALWHRRRGEAMGAALLQIRAGEVIAAAMQRLEG